MKGFQSRTSRLFMALFIGLVVLLGVLAEQPLRERIQPKPLQVPAAEQSSSIAPVRADGPLDEVRQRGWAEIGVQPRWTF
ncbi:hypothetical protein E8F11_27935 [Pseudomonas sp. BN417]|uniref:hypothetical protein n=1 Tax=Pseudomonas sp. BN417 TaxID=2567890 RepID=UPI002455CDC6|nr:hypothetical protein [Pseudomonas sp. BN417]MDH4558958.1 hypothetical protein [Pseudomonas sp. BN417]